MVMTLKEWEKMMLDKMEANQKKKEDEKDDGKH